MDLGDLYDEIRKAKQKPHGHVTSIKQGLVNRCGGPAICRHCLLEAMAPMISRFLNIGETHGVGCWSWGRGHYDCALAHIEELEATVEELITANDAERAKHAAPTKEGEE